MRLLKTLFITLCIIFAGQNAYALQGKGTPEDPYILKWANYYPDAGPIGHDIQANTADWIEKQMGGKIKFERYYGGSLHSLADGFKALRSGLSDMAQAYPFNNTQAFKYLTSTSLPWLFNTQAQATATTQEMWPEWFKKEFEKQGIAIAITPFFGYDALITKKPVRNMEDLKGMKIMAHGIHSRAMLEELGATPVFITPPELFVALQRGVIDGLIWAPGCTVPWKFHEVAPYATKVDNITQDSIFWGMHKESFNQLPPDIKKELYEVLQNASTYMSKKYVDIDVTGYDDLKNHGMEVIELDPEELARWKEKSKVVWEKNAKDLNKAGLKGDEFQKVLRETADKYNKMSAQEIVDYRKANPVPGMISGM